MKNRQLAINMIASMITFIINLGISFFLAPFIINKLGREAYGFIGLINNFVSYASIVTIALNSMADRFITLKIHQDDQEGAKVYFNSALIGNLIMAAFFALISLIMLINLGSLINIPKNLNGDVRIAFSLVALEFIILFALFPAKIFFVNIASLSAAVLVVITNIYFTIKLLPEIQIGLRYFKFTAILELIQSGMWNVLTILSQILESGLDLLFANIFLGASLDKNHIS